jgi:hypothetical protein
MIKRFVTLAREFFLKNVTLTVPDCGAEKRLTEIYPPT